MTKRTIHKKLFMICVLSGMGEYWASAQEPSRYLTSSVDNVSNYLCRGSKFGL
jgi:hypothetical protein